ncbi:MAG: hypothetical protein ACOC4K_00410 [Verrucomicrobiota bacterium]
MNDTDTTPAAGSIDTIDRLTEAYALHREGLADTLREMEAQLQAVRDHFLPDLKSRASATGQAKDRLAAAILDDPDRFVKPRSIQLHGVKVGFQSVPEKVAPGPNTVELIEKNFPERAEQLIEVKKKPILRALRELTRGERRLAGCQTVEAEDVVLIKPTGDAVEKLVDKIIDDASATAEG